jgi:hypothetical protein
MNLHDFKGKMTPEREAVFQTVMTQLEDPRKLRTLADIFEKEELHDQAMHLRTRATTKEAERVTGRKRDPGIIVAALKNSGAPSVEISVVLENQDVQSFRVSFLREEDAEKFLPSLLAVFGKSEMNELVGLKVHALRAWDDPSEPIEGLEDPETKRRITRTSWLRSFDPTGQHPSPLDRRAARIVEDITRLRIELEGKSEEMKNLEDGYTDWEKVP